MEAPPGAQVPEPRTAPALTVMKALRLVAQAAGANSDGVSAWHCVREAATPSSSGHVKKHTLSTSASSLTAILTPRGESNH